MATLAEFDFLGKALQEGKINGIEITGGSERVLTYAILQKRIELLVTRKENKKTQTKMLNDIHKLQDENSELKNNKKENAETFIKNLNQIDKGLKHGFTTYAFNIGGEEENSESEIKNNKPTKKKIILYLLGLVSGTIVATIGVVWVIKIIAGM